MKHFPTNFFYAPYNVKNLNNLSNMTDAFCDMVKHELQVMSSEFRVTSYELRVTS